MSNYIKTTDFAIKDTYASGDSRKIAKGADVDVEFNNIATAVATKYDTSNVGIANGVCPLNTSALVTKTFQWTTTAYTDAAAQTFTGTMQVNGTFTLGASSGLVFSTFGATPYSGKIHIGDGSGWKLALTGAGSADVITFGDAGAIIANGAITGASFSGSGASLTSLNASNISAGSIGSSFVPSGAVTQYASSMKCRNHPSRGGTNVTLQAGGSPSGGSDGDLFYIY